MSYMIIKDYRKIIKDIYVYSFDKHTYFHYTGESLSDYTQLAAANALEPGECQL